MRTALALACLLACLTTVFCQTETRQIPLPTSKFLRAPSPGRIGPLNSFPATIAVSPDHQFAVFLNDGYGTQASNGRQSIAVLDLKTNQITDFPDERLSLDAHQSYFVGLAFSSDGEHLYASIGSITDPTGERRGDTGNGIAVYSFREGKVAPERFLKIPLQKLAAGKKIAYELRKSSPAAAIPYPAGLAVIPQRDGDKLLIANNLADNIVLLDARNGRILQSFDLSTNSLVPSSFPYTVVVSRDGKRAWCSLWNSPKIAELDLLHGTVARWISLASPQDPLAPTPHNTAMLLDRDEHMLFVAMANSDRVAVIAADSGTLSGYLDTTVSGQKYGGTSPTSLARSADGRYLFVADSAVNGIAVFDVPGFFSEPQLAASGFIPTDWYPSALATLGDDLLVATAKGEGTGPDNGRSRIVSNKKQSAHPYIATLLYGSVARLNFHNALKQLPQLTRQVQETNLFGSNPGKLQFAGGRNPIRHVIYVLKENRTYDQILGDLQVGNGDPSLTMYGAEITPNEHKLARQFGVLDNFYDSGEVSGNGHNWSTAAITTDYNEMTWQIAYRGKERTYDYQGEVAGEIPLESNELDVDDPATGYIWDNLARNGFGYRDYGEFTVDLWCSPGNMRKYAQRCSQSQVRKGEPLPPNLGQPHGSKSPWPWAIPMPASAKATKSMLRGHFDPNYPGFEVDYPDQLRADEFLNEFAEFVRARKEGRGTELPQFVLLYLPDNHTGGTRPGKPRPAASVADNDLALGRVVEAVSHSPYWDDTAIFVVEDDAQNGADHVDAHRSTAFVISKYSPGSQEHPFVDHHFYTTVNLVHTMEAVLGLPPMNQNDAYAPLMTELFSGPGTQAPFTADWRNRDSGLIYLTNSLQAPGAEESQRMNFFRPDAANAAVLNAILWHDIKGTAPMPAPLHAVLPE